MTSTEARPLPLERSDPFDPPTGLRTADPISPLLLSSGSTGWLVTRHSDAREILADTRFSSDRTEVDSPVRPIPEEMRTKGSAPGMFIGMDRPEHTRYRKLLTGQFTVRRMQALEGRIAEIVDAHLDAMTSGGARTADLVGDFALPVPSLVICELLGVRYTDRARFQQTTAGLLRLDNTPEQIRASRNSLREFMYALVEGKRAEPDEALISGLIADTDLTDEELVNIATLLLIAGHETTANMLALGTFALLTHPEQLSRLRAQPELIPRAVEELLRYLSIVHIGPIRVATEDLEIGGVHIEAGQTVLISLPMANRDSELVAQPDDLDVSRARTHHLAFGHGVHQCLGQQLARSEMTIGFAALLSRLPELTLAIPATGVPMRTDMAIYGVHSLPVRW
ncbi:MAG: cytochrome P450 [Sciscionella sp.]